MATSLELCGPSSVLTELLGLDPQSQQALGSWPQVVRELLVLDPKGSWGELCLEWGAVPSALTSLAAGASDGL